MDHLRLNSDLPAELEALVHDAIGCCLAVHIALGPGWLEGVYSRAVAIELTARRISFETEKAIPIRYRDTLLCHHRLDLFINGQLVLEVKAIEQINPIHVAQVLSYMRATGSRVGLLVNFNVPVLKQGIRRIVL